MLNLLKTFGLSSKITDPLASGTLGNIAIALLLYKIATPARYAVTIFVTIKMIKILVRKGMIKPIPSKAKIKNMIQESVTRIKKE